MVPEEGVEPTHSCEYGILSPARLPVPPLRLELFRITANVPRVPLFHSSTVGFPPLEPWNRWDQTVELWNRGTVEPNFYRRAPVQVPEQVPPENVPVIDRRSGESVALNV